MVAVIGIHAAGAGCRRSHRCSGDRRVRRSKAQSICLERSRSCDRRLQSGHNDGVARRIAQNASGRSNHRLLGLVNRRPRARTSTHYEAAGIADSRFGGPRYSGRGASCGKGRARAPRHQRYNAHLERRWAQCRSGRVADGDGIRR